MNSATIQMHCCCWMGEDVMRNLSNFTHIFTSTAIISQTQFNKE